MPAVGPLEPGEEREVMLAGIRCFNGGRYFEAHDEWEKLWLRRGPGGRPFVQSLIQLAAAYHNLGRGKPAGAVRLFDIALRRLADFPQGWAGIDRRELVAAVERHREALLDQRSVERSDFPLLVVPDEQRITVGDR